MRIVVDIPERDLEKLSRISKKRKVSRATLVRSAIDEYLKAQSNDSLDQFSGLWVDCKIDGLEYQEQMRREWERES